MSSKTIEQLQAELNAVIGKNHKEDEIGLVDINRKLDFIPTGSIMLDRATGIGGVPRGGSVEIYGKESAGKTTLCYHIIREAQSLGLNTALIDVEHSLIDPAYPQKIGVDFDKLLVHKPTVGEAALDMVIAMAKTGEFGLIVLDSIAALVASSEMEQDVGESMVGARARILAKAAGKLHAIAERTNTCVVFTNQMRDIIGQAGFGPTTTTPGGKSMKHLPLMRIELKNIKRLAPTGGDPYGNTIQARIMKSKVSAPYRIATYDLIYGDGIIKERELLTIGKAQGVVKGSGAWFSYGEDKLGQGLDASIKFLQENPEVATEIETQVLQNLWEGMGIPQP